MLGHDNGKIPKSAALEICLFIRNEIFQISLKDFNLIFEATKKFQVFQDFQGF